MGKFYYEIKLSIDRFEYYTDILDYAKDLEEAKQKGQQIAKEFHVDASECEIKPVTFNQLKQCLTVSQLESMFGVTIVEHPILSIAFTKDEKME